MSVLLYKHMLILASLGPLLSLLQEYSWSVDISILNLSTYNMSLSFYLDKQASAFLITVLCIFTMVFMYTFSYMSLEVNLKRFLGILTLFVLSMCVLVLSGNMFSSMVGWDGLGVTSMFLILFYYSNSALKASSLTFLMNRVGDCFFIMTLTSMLLLGENQVFFTSSVYTWHISVLLLLTSISKSAQIPFSTWLPAAMEAPTPVSSLVHSSTLVTAGIFLMYRYNQMWVESWVSEMLLILSVSTCFMAALSALVESDLKKLIALSTLSQLGFIMFSFSLGLLSQGFFHMLMHAYFKALLFMCAGLMIHAFKGSQSLFSLSSSSNQNPLLMFIMSLSLMSMMGLPFLAGFYSKDQIIDSLKLSSWSYFVYLILMLSLVLTVLYSMRMTWYLMSSAVSWHCMSDSDYNMIKPMLPLAFLACSGGSVLSWLLLDVGLYINNSKLGVLSLMLMSISSYWVIKSISSSNFLESKWNLSMFNSILSSAFFLVSMKYYSCSDMLGVPELLNKKTKFTLESLSGLISKTMLCYSGNLELLLFLVTLVIMY